MSDRTTTIDYSFVDYIPDQLEDGVLYVSIEFGTAAHNCLCGCGREVTTPLSPVDWSLIYDGETVSLSPSIGNWSFDCRSHYWIKRNRVLWASEWSQEKIDTARTQERLADQAYLNEGRSQEDLGGSDEIESLATNGSQEKNLWDRLKSWFIWR